MSNKNLQVFRRHGLDSDRTHELWCGNYRRSGLVISREQGLRYDAGFAVPVLMS